MGGDWGVYVLGEGGGVVLSPVRSHVDAHIYSYDLYQKRLKVRKHHFRILAFKTERK